MEKPKLFKLIVEVKQRKIAFMKRGIIEKSKKNLNNNAALIFPSIVFVLESIFVLEQSEK